LCVCGGGDDSRGVLGCRREIADDGAHERLPGKNTVPTGLPAQIMSKM
jgi:hypothetical protein